MQHTVGPGRSPRCEMTGADVLALVNALESAGIRAWLDGGWAVDAVLGAQTRRHDDLDLIVQLRDVDGLVAALGRLGFAVARGRPPKSFELLDSRGRQVDVHPIVFSTSGDGVYRLESDEDWTYPARGFAGLGHVAGQPVRCLTPEVQILCHTGYEPHRDSYDDVWALGRRFDIPVPSEYHRPRETYPARGSE